MSKSPSLLEMLQAGLHFGHQAGRWHPKMKPYIFTERNGVHVIDLEKTQKKLEEALNFIKTTVQKGGVVLFLGTKKQAQSIVKKYAQECGMPYIDQRWLGGTLTNFSVILKLTKKYKDLKSKRDTGGFKVYTKKEQLDFQREIERLELRVGGVAELKKIPDVIFVVDVKNEKTAVVEASRKGVPVVAICDSNINPDLMDYPIPANDDAVKSIELITSLIAEAVKEGQGAQEAGKVAK
ncbi:MAG: 30S ribosomal protein S2 [Patescibacteria group bacterium]